MPIRVALHHKTTYRYDRPVTLSPHVVRLRPAPHCRTPIPAYSLKVTPSPHFLNWQQDPFSNYQARVVFPEPARELCVEVDLVAELTVINPFDFFIEEAAEHFPLVYEAGLRRELLPYLDAAPAGSKLASLLEDVRARYCRKGRLNIDVLVDLNRHLLALLRYDIRMQPGVFTPEESLTAGHGSCRDFAWLSAQMLRHLGYATRFVSGYSIQLKADERPLTGPAGVEEDATDLHAWTEVYLPGAGWVGLDATNGLLAGEGHIPLACTPDPLSAAPITGSYAFAKTSEKDSVEESFDVTMKVTRIQEEPRPTKPYSPEQWAAIDALGSRVDAVLVQGDVRLTMGGEPTFVAVDDPEGEEWNTAALGPTKRQLSGALLRRLRGHYAPTGLLHYGQGKWYPGEPLPRWALSCYWRKDGAPVWSDPELFATDDEVRHDGPVQADAFVSALSKRLGIDASHAIPGFEDAWYYLWRERRLPVDLDPFDAKLERPEERARLASVFEQGLTKVVGYALPIRKREPGVPGAWESGPWSFRAQRMYLVPGDSPMGLRLPLESLPWSSGKEELGIPRDPWAAYPPLPPPSTFTARMQQPGAEKRHSAGALPPAAEPLGSPHVDLRVPGVDPRVPPGQSAAEPSTRHTRGAVDVVRTALCVEPRGGALHVFMPPLPLLEDYLELCHHIEQAARELGTKVRIEGYAPPNDPRLEKLQITPDPGVIEVNVQPAHSWDELVRNTTTLYAEARNTRLGTQKFMLDGRDTGTGGGNHIVLGGATPQDSPLLRRPHLLRSMVGYWLNHPSLSYLFSGLFVGATSQAPRVDEARQDTLHELAIAFDELERRSGDNVPPWLVDRIFRHLLVDVTGNTHRTEFCIDKLYSPDTASGRLGLLELRAMEMPPHAHMSLSQQLLIRALVAHFWSAPYRVAPVKWGTALHDRFMLPHFVAQDFEEVMFDLGQAGFDFRGEWYRPHLDFRFPILGAVQAQSVELELRQAIEPWNVLGEEPAGGTTARYVDSSVERVQVKLRGLTDERHLLACNGRRVPLHPTGTIGEFVAGVRYRAWQPPNALHPTIPVHAPLVFDLVDTWNRRSVMGCSYHVAHPGGRSYDQLPRNSFEAEGRRVSRFVRFGHTPLLIDPPPCRVQPHFPLTLDLRALE